MVVAIPFCGFWTKAIAITHMAMTRDATPFSTALPMIKFLNESTMLPTVNKDPKMSEMDAVVITYFSLPFRVEGGSWSTSADKMTTDRAVKATQL